MKMRIGTTMSYGTSFSPKVSIVIPVYNGSNYLRQAIESALLQTYSNIEVLVINDGSDDGGETERIARSYGDRIRYFYKENGGVGSALNLGIERMTGEYFSWLSHDDRYYSDKVETQIAYLSGLEMKEVILYSGFDIIDSNSEVIGRSTFPSYESYKFLYEVLSHSFLNGCTVLVPKSCFDKVGVFNEALKTTQDYDLWVRLAKHFDFVNIPEILIQSRQHREQGSLGLEHIEDIDNFYVWCLHEVGPENIENIYGMRPSQFYYNTALSYKGRGLIKAYSHAIAYAKAHARKENAWALLRINLETTALGERILLGWSFARRFLNRSYCRMKTPKPIRHKFTEIYKRNIWNCKESRSGVGASSEQTAIIRIEIPRLVRELGIRSLLDAPCGDFNWMKDVSLGIERYIGVDIVEELIKANKERYGDPRRHFVCLDLIRDELPQAEIVLCRDCLVHLQFDQALDALRNFKRTGAKYLLTTTFIGRRVNEEGSNKDSEFFWRPLNLEVPPFNFPRPIKVIKEGCTECNSQFEDKCLGLWRLQDLSL